jgi:periplasmic divalent cation tolerance protein
MPASTYSLVYITCKDKKQARTIGRALVEERLAACANIIDKMNSLYWWEGAVQDDSETVLIVKTRRTLVPALARRVKQLHSYTVPCVVTTPIVGGNADFLAWIGRETRRASRPHPYPRPKHR